LKIIISPYLSEKSSDFDFVHSSAHDQKLKSCTGQTRSSTERISYYYYYHHFYYHHTQGTTCVHKSYKNQLTI